jgi:hyperosmotically inducible periplasmic protein
MKAMVRKVMGSLAAVTLLAGMTLAQTASSARYDSNISQKVTQELAQKKQFRNVQASVEDGIVTLKGTVDVYQDKLDASKKAKKVEHASGVRNLIEVAGPTVPDAQLQAQLAKKLRYDRVGYYDNVFDYLTIGVNNGVVTIGGATLNDVARDSALAIVQRTSGVRDVVSEITILPVSLFDDSIRLRTARAIYRDPVLGKYGTDPSRPIRIIVDKGTVSLYGAVDSAMDKQIAGIRANEVPGAFRVENHLTVD